MTWHISFVLSNFLIGILFIGRLQRREQQSETLVQDFREKEVYFEEVRMTHQRLAPIIHYSHNLFPR